MAATKQKQDEQSLALKDAAQLLLDECRMVLPGIQALFGFQLVVVFNSGFRELLSRGEQHLHLLAIMLLAVAIALIMTPAALHRQAGAFRISQRIIRVGTRLLLCSMLPLGVGICIDFYLVARVLGADGLLPWLTGGLFGLFVFLWYVLPLWLRRRP